MSSSRNVERSSTFDRKTMNKVRTKKGDKFEEKNWSSSASNENGQEEDDDEDVLQKLPRLPSSFQQALTAARLVELRIFCYCIRKFKNSANASQLRLCLLQYLLVSCQYG